MKNITLKEDVLGSYLPGYFAITINSDTDFRTVSEEDASTLVHEYIHFLQNISTVSGLTILSCVGSWVGHLTHGIYHNNKHGELVRKFPYYGDDNHSAQFIETFDAIIISLYGDREKPVLDILADKYAVSNVSLSPFSDNDVFDEITPMPARFKHSGRCLVEYSYVGATKGATQFPTLTVDVGAICIYEFMAHSIQKKLYEKTAEPPKVPYLVVKDVANFISGYVVNDDILVAICELTLQSPFPGEELYKILNGFNDQNIDLNTISKEQLMTLCNSTYFIQEDYDLIENNVANSAGEMKKYTRKMLLERQIEEVKKDFRVFLQGNDDLEKAYGALVYLLDTIHSFRGDDLLPISELMFLEKDEAFTYLNGIIKKIGMPLLFNNNGYVGQGIATKDCDEQFFLFYTLYQYIRVFMYGKKTCDLINSCKNYQNNCVNENCSSNPHLKGREKWLCTLGQLIKFWGLSKYQFE
ncbi:hypothetical protein C1Y43_16295 [Pantoea sp. ICBG 828]|uniref:hypothetical protein n=1 Tax=unclassified Pantoea TaxID=2630326 RepID=UPI000CE3B228|nr:MULTISPECIES: hypothetical protein [unclassified Pantoea]NIG35735.1 hypothetical protein [Pantoea sp. Ap-959]PPC66333.1 hypothetical protein C1Y43_16295 [Pantoea sp. ICBG 828]